MRSLERVNIRTNESTYVLTYIRTGQTLYPLHNFVVRGDNDDFFIAVYTKNNLLSMGTAQEMADKHSCILFKIFFSCCLRVTVN